MNRIIKAAVRVVLCSQAGKRCFQDHRGLIQVGERMGGTVGGMLKIYEVCVIAEAKAGCGCEHPARGVEVGCHGGALPP